MLDATIEKKLRDFTLDLSFSVKSGEIVALMGPNGAGKSTTLNIIAGLLPQDAGEIELNGITVFNSSQGIQVTVEDRKIGYVFQPCAVFPHITVSENIAFGLRAWHLSRPVIEKRVIHWLEILNLKDIATVKAGKISGGQKQRVALARALAIEPNLIMLDEPFTALDTESDRGVKIALKKIVAEMQIPCIVVSHGQTDIRDIADRVCIIRKGRLVWEGLPSNIPASMGTD